MWLFLEPLWRLETGGNSPQAFNLLPALLIAFLYSDELNYFPINCIRLHFLPKKPLRANIFASYNGRRAPTKKW